MHRLQVVWLPVFLASTSLATVAPPPSPSPSPSPSTRVYIDYRWGDGEGAPPVPLPSPPPPLPGVAALAPGAAPVAPDDHRILDDHLLAGAVDTRSWLEPQLLRRHHAQRRRAIHLERATSGGARRNVHPGYD